MFRGLWSGVGVSNHPAWEDYIVWKNIEKYLTQVKW
jgi:hypothetical protein